MGSFTLSQRISSWAVDLTPESVPEVVKQRFMLHVLDTIGCGFAAIRKGEFTNVADLAAIAAAGSGASILGRPGKFVIEQAAFANGALFHALDFDDTHSTAILHPTAVSLATALAIGEETKASAEDIFLATLAGVEVTCRIGMARHNAFHLKGFHPTSVAGTIGAAVTAGLLLRLDAAQMVNVMGIAGSLSCGIFAYLDGASNPKPIHAGQAAKNGLEAARLAGAGVTGPETVFESRFGLFGAFLGDAESLLPELIDNLGQEWESGKLSIKPYPACHAMHACLDCAADLLKEHRFAAANIQNIKVFLSSERDINLVMEPLDVKIAPKSGTVGKFSLPYSMAALLVDEKLGVDSYDAAHLERPEVLKISKVISYEQHEFTTAGKALPGAVEIKLTTGEVLRSERLNERGGPHCPLTNEEILEKFASNYGDLDIWQEMAVVTLFDLARKTYGYTLV